MASDFDAQQRAGAGLVAAGRVIRERWWVILLTAVVTTGVAVAHSLTSQKQYQATSKVVLRDSSQLNNAVVNGSVASGDPQTVAATNLLLVTSNPVAQGVIQTLGLKEPTDTVLGQVNASIEPNSNLVDITVTDHDPNQAARIATAFAQEYVAYRQQTARGDISQGEQLLRSRLAQLAPNATADRAELEAALQRVIALEAVQTGDASVVDSAQVPSTASSPKPKRDAILGLILGLILGVGIAFLVDLLDRRMKTDEAFEQAYGLRTLVHVPSSSFTTKALDVHSSAFEPYRILASTLSYSTMADQIRTVLITSAAPREGKTTVAANLAVAVALSGRTVTLVEGDLRRPSFESHFDLHPGVGLTTALIGGQPVADVIQHPVVDLPNLAVLPSGPIPPSAVELLRSSMMDQVITDLIGVSEIVIFDTPPILGLADAQAMLDNPQIDTALIVARAYRTTRDEVRRTRALFQQRRVTPLGLVLTGLDESGNTEQYYTGSVNGSGVITRGRSRKRTPKVPAGAAPP